MYYTPTFVAHCFPVGILYVQWWIVIDVCPVPCNDVLCGQADSLTCRKYIHVMQSSQCHFFNVLIYVKCF